MVKLALLGPGWPLILSFGFGYACQCACRNHVPAECVILCMHAATMYLWFVCNFIPAYMWQAAILYQQWSVCDCVHAATMYWFVWNFVPVSLQSCTSSVCDCVHAAINEPCTGSYAILNPFYPSVRVIDYYYAFKLIASHSVCACALVQPSSAFP